WSSDVCSSDLSGATPYHWCPATAPPASGRPALARAKRATGRAPGSAAGAAQTGPSSAVTTKQLLQVPLQLDNRGPPSQAFSEYVHAQLIAFDARDQGAGKQSDQRSQQQAGPGRSQYHRIGVPRRLQRGVRALRTPGRGASANEHVLTDERQASWESEQGLPQSTQPQSQSLVAGQLHRHAAGNPTAQFA